MIRLETNIDDHIIVGRIYNEQGVKTSAYLVPQRGILSQQGFSEEQVEMIESYLQEDDEKLF